MGTNKFLSIYNDIVEHIRNGQMMANTLLPSEHELAVQYNTSRETLRKALNLLSQNGYIQKVQGKGSIVLDVNRFNFPVSGLVSFKEIAESSGKPWHTVVHELALMKADQLIQRQLQLSPQDDVWKIVRSRHMDGESIILDIDYVKKQLVETLSKGICEKSLYEYFEKTCGLSISFAKKEITVEEATPMDHEYLDLKDMKHVVVVKKFVHLEDATLLQYTESRHRLDKFRFVDFARRQSR